MLFASSSDVDQISRWQLYVRIRARSNQSTEYSVLQYSFLDLKYFVLLYSCLDLKYSVPQYSSLSQTGAPRATMTQATMATLSPLNSSETLAEINTELLLGLEVSYICKWWRKTYVVFLSPPVTHFEADIDCSSGCEIELSADDLNLSSTRIEIHILNDLKTSLVECTVWVWNYYNIVLEYFWQKRSLHPSLSKTQHTAGSVWRTRS